MERRASYRHLAKVEKELVVLEINMNLALKLNTRERGGRAREVEKIVLL